MSFSLPTFSLEDLLQRGVHFGHKRARWNPKMAPYIYKEHHGVHIIDLPKTITMMQHALNALYGCVKEGGRILFVGTKLQARDAVKEAAVRCGQYYVNHRWLGGTLTNWKTISESLKKLRDVEQKIASPEFGAYTKKEQLEFHRSLDKYNRSLGGIRNMGGLPDMIFIIDINKEMVAVKEARHLGIPIVAIVDTNTDPSLVDYPVPGNDDASRAIEFYCDVMARTVISGLQEEWNRQAQRQGGQHEFSAETLPPRPGQEDSRSSRPRSSGQRTPRSRDGNGGGGKRPTGGFKEGSRFGGGNRHTSGMDTSASSKGKPLSSPSASNPSA